MKYLEMRTKIADALGVEREDVRCNDLVGSWAVKIAGGKEAYVLTPDLDDAIAAIRRIMGEMR